MFTRQRVGLGSFSFSFSSSPLCALHSSACGSRVPSLISFVSLAAFLVVLCGVVPGSKADIYGSGALNVYEVFNEVSSLYKFTRDRVDIHFAKGTIPEALTKYGKGELDFFISDVGLTPTQLAPFNGIQIPMVGTPLVLAFNLPGFGPSDTILMDRETLARIWMGEIRMWNDPAITKWNEGVTIPAINISMTYWSPSSSALGYTAIFKTALSRFSPAFAAALAAANNTLENMLPSKAAVPWAFAGPAFESGEFRINRTRNTPGMMTYLERQGADAIGLPYIRLINKANKSVEATPQSVQAAMNHFSDLISNGTLVIDVVDCDAEDAWPLSFLSYLTLSKKIEPTTGGCSRASDMLLFLSWTQLNEEVSRVFVSDQFAPLTNPYRRRLINELYTITCENAPVLTTPVLLGIGVQPELLGDWTQSYSAQSFSIKHYDATSRDAQAQILAGDADYAVTYSWENKKRANDSSVVQMPGVAFAVGPAYYVSGLSPANVSLILDMPTLAAIIAGQITRWNDTAIMNLNPMISSFPATAINVVVGCDNSTGLIAPMLQQALEGAPAEDAAMARLLSASGCFADPVSRLSSTDNSIGVWYTTQVVAQVRNVKLGRLVNAQGNVVSPNQTCIQSAVQDFASDSSAELLINGQGDASWPIVGYAFLALKSQATGDFSTAQGLLEWVYWTQTSSQAQSIANNYNLAVPGSVPELTQRTISQLASITHASDGAFVFALQPCVYNGTICADHGSCSTSNGQVQCSCSSGWVGQYCETARSESSSSSDVLAPVLGTVLPVGILIVLALIVAVIIAALIVSRRRPAEDDWEIDYEELEVGDMLGHGGYGEVWKAKWKGSEVAVKVMGAHALTREARERFVNEARIMSRLRHPNIVLFMAASTKPPKLCIVMEYMALGSLFDLLHNEFITELPQVLKIKIVHQAAKGMHFLHSSGIAHRDLKSLNLLLDNKWNVKVSDFGLTNFRESLAKGKGRNSKAIEGSVPWMAPEVLEDAADVNHALADIYAYGIIMWEVLTRNQPYQGLSPAVIAVGVIRNDLRPKLPSDLLESEQGYADLMMQCWHRDPTLRPSFDHIMAQLKTLLELTGQGSSMMTGTTTSSSSSMSSFPNFARQFGRKPGLDSGSLSSSATGSREDGHMRSGSASSSDAGGGGVFIRNVGVPRRDVSFVVCDLARCNESWQNNPAGAAKAISRYGRVVRELAAPGEVAAGTSVKQRAGGYVFSRSALHSGGTFMVAFANPVDAAEFALTLQRKLNNKKFAKGVELHSRVAVHFREGSSRAPADDLTRTGYDSTHFGNACRLNLRCAPGSVACSPEFRTALELATSSDTSRSSFKFSSKGDDVFALRAADEDDHDEGSADEEWDGRWDEGMGLCSSNWCPWVIDRRKITTGNEIGRGNYGQVVRGTYDGRHVAIKKLYKGRLDDETMIKMRKEAAILSNIDHPNVVKLIGFSIPTSDGSPGQQGGPMLVMELVPRGSLRGLLSDRSIKLTWERRLRMLRDAALGVAHLHERGVLHRDIKSSNLLVDEDWTVKVGDFGFATAKQDNGTMTRCGTPCWTAPEIMSDSTRKYSEKADVYSFGIVMWEVITREEPYQHKNMTTVAMDVINGERPPLPSDCPKAIGELIQRCWLGKPASRPDMEEIVMFLNAETGRGHDA